MLRGARPARVTYRPWEATVRGEVRALLTTMATNVKNNLTVAAWGAALPDVVTSNIRTALGGVVATGTYNSVTGVHAEIAAIVALGPAAWVNPHIIRTTLEPCHRCAAILRAFVVQYGWTVEAPAQAFASNYPGAYYLPANVYAVVATQFGTIPAPEQAHYENEIKSLICGFGVA